MLHGGILGMYAGARFDVGQTRPSKGKHLLKVGK